METFSKHLHFDGNSYFIPFIITQNVFIQAIVVIYMIFSFQIWLCLQKMEAIRSTNVNEKPNWGRQK